MSKPWPDEVRQMVDALMHGGACPRVYGCSDGGWRIHTGKAWADYDERGRWWFDGSFHNAAFVLAELLQRSDTTAPETPRDLRYALRARILAAVPTARVTTTTDGIEVSVGSKSVRWKREKRGWSRDDDLGTGSYAGSDERVIEHAKGMLADAAAETQWKLATDLSSRLKAKGIETCTVRNVDTGVVTVSAESTLGFWHSAELRDGRWHHGDVVLTTTAEAYRVLLEAVAPKPAAPPSLLDRLCAAIPSLTWRQEGEGAWIGSDGHDLDFARIVWRLDLGKRQEYLVACSTGGNDPLAFSASVTSAEQAIERVRRYVAETVARHEAPVAPQPSPRALDTATQATASKRSPRELAAHELVALFQREFPGASVGFAGDGSRVWVEQWSERVVWEQGPTPGCWWRDGRIATNAQRIMATTRNVLDAAAQRRGCSTVTVNGKVLDTEALTRAIEEQSKREKAHAAKGTTMTTQPKALDQAKMDASEAALRTAARQLAKAARDPLAGAVARHLAPGDDSMRAKVAALLETEAGLAMLKAVLSLSLGAIPQSGTRGAALAHELRVQAMSDGADLALDLVMGPLREVVALYLQDPAGAPAAAPALDAPQHAPASVDWSTAREVSR